MSGEEDEQEEGEERKGGEERRVRGRDRGKKKGE